MEEEIIGKKFGHLTIIKHDPEYKFSKNHFICQCDCGRLKKAIRKYLEGGQSTTCGQTKVCKYAFEDRSMKRRKHNKYDLSGTYGIGYTNEDHKEFYFDLEDYDKIKDFTWYLDENGYVRTNTFDFENNKRSYMFMHNYIMNLPNDSSIIADHIHGRDTVNDNRKNNLRIVEKWMNNVNQDIRKDNTSGVKGVNYHPQKNKWVARIQKKKKRIYLGAFDNFNDAVNARIKAEKIYHGDYAYLVSQSL